MGHDALRDMLDSYFGDRALAESVRHLAAVMDEVEGGDAQVLAALDEGIAEARGGSEELVALITGSHAALVRSPTEAAAFLEELRSAYLRERDASRRADG